MYVYEGWSVHHHQTVSELTKKKEVDESSKRRKRGGERRTYGIVIAHAKRKLGTVLDVEIFERVPVFKAFVSNQNHVVDDTCICRPSRNPCPVLERCLVARVVVEDVFCADFFVHVHIGDARVEPVVPRLLVVPRGR